MLSTLGCYAPVGWGPWPYRVIPAAAAQRVLSPSHFKSGLFNLRDDLCESRAGSHQGVARNGHDRRPLSLSLPMARFLPRFFL